MDRHATEMIARGPTLAGDGDTLTGSVHIVGLLDPAAARANAVTWLGTAVLIRAPDPDTARAILTADRYADIEVHSWQFGGRPS